jgi:C-terminal processing protease CtpA/Prc
MPTMGALSTALEKELPNGWKFALSNEYYRNLEGEYFENRGIPVEYEIDYPEDRQEFFKSVLEGLELDKNRILNSISELKKISGED